MLEQEGVEYRYREVRTEPLGVPELEALLVKLGLSIRDLMRRRDRAFAELELTGVESDPDLLALVAEHPTLLQRPIGVTGDRAVLGRPVERLLELR